MLRFALVLTLLGLAHLATSADERRVVVIASENPRLPVNVGDYIRISEKLEAGAEITAKIDGPGRLVHTNSADKVKDAKFGRFWVAGAGKEFEIHAQNEGKITVTLTLDSKRENTPVQTKVYTIGVRNPPFMKLKDKGRNIVVIADNKQPAKAKVLDIIRVTASRQAGPGKTTVQIEGKGKLINTNSLSQISDRGPLVGAVVTEYEVLAEAKGKITITCATFIERLNSQKSTTYTIDVE